MTTEKTIRDLIADHPFFGDLANDDIDLIAGCGRNVVFEPGAFVFKEGDEATHFHLIRDGDVRLEIHAPQGPLAIQTLHGGDILGWSWLVPPHTKRFDARVLTRTRAVAMDGVCLRRKCDEDPRLGYELLQRFAHIIGERLQATRLQLLNLYGEAPTRAEGEGPRG